MALETRLIQKLSQSLLMTPQLQQAIKLLQLGRLDYINALEREVLENPVLEIAEDENPIAETKTDGVDQSGDTPPPYSSSGSTDADDADPATDNAAGSIESILTNSNESQSWSGSRDDLSSTIEAAVAESENLLEHIASQLRGAEIADKEKPIAIHAIGNLDADGYLAVTYDELAETAKCSVDDVAHVMEIIKSLDPPGIGARNLSECLVIQLEKIGLGDSLAASIVAKHLDKLEKQKFDAIARSEKVKVEDVYEAVMIIRSLEPRPARQFQEAPTRYVVPDIYVQKVGNEWVITLNEDGLPKLRISSYYLDLLRSAESSSAEQRVYLNERLKAASWLIKSIHQRQTTIYRVAESIVKFQRDFLESGVSKLRPLVLKDVADDIGMHESTISRVTANKYIHTPQGVFELKYFFTTGIKTQEGEMSSSTIKERIRQLVADEDPLHPISDQELVERLSQDKIQIARRTVAKYRELLGILPSVKRRKLF